MSTETQISAQEAAIRQTIVRVDQIYDGFGKPRDLGKRVGECWKISNDVRFVAKYLCDLILPKINGTEMHENFGATDEPFGHYLNISSDLKYLIDLSFCQFVKPSNGLISQKYRISGNIANFPSIQPLLKNGYMELTDDSLREYLSATTNALGRYYIQKATVEDLRKVVEI